MAARTLSERRVVVHRPPTGRIPPLGEVLASVWERRFLVWHLTRTDLKGQHYDTALGKLWLVLDPLFMAATFFMLRLVLRPSGASDQGFFIAHLIMGVSFFFFVSSLVSTTARCIHNNKSLVLNTAAPRAVFPAVTVLTGLVTLVPTVAIYFVVHLILGQPWGVSLVFLPLVILLLTAFGLGFGLAYAPVAVLSPDALSFLPFITRIWLYATPVMFAVSEIPEQVKVVYVLNPLYPSFAMLEQIFTGEMPSPTYMVAAIGWALVAGIGGGYFFLRKERDFAVRL